MATSARGRNVRRLVTLAMLAALLAAGAGVGAAPALAASAPVYAVQDLGVISAPLTDALKADQTCAAAGVVTGGVSGVNDAGVAVGNIPAANLFPAAATFSAAGVTSLKSGKNGGQGYAVNPAGVVVGIVYNTPLASPCGYSLDTSPAEWVKGAVKKLPLPKGDDAGVAFGINAAGDIVGHAGSVASPAKFHAVLWKNGKIARVETPSCPDGSANAGFLSINDAGEIAGSSCGQAAWWSKDGTLTPLKPLTGGSAAFALGIGADGSIVGFTLQTSNGSQITRPTLWTKGKATALALPKGAAMGIATQTNGKGEIVGKVDNAAVVWIDGKPSVLADHLALKFAGAIVSAGGVNASGQIACAAKIGTETHALLLTPKP